MNWEYITGFFDADGSVTISALGKGRNKAPQIAFHNNELDILVKIQSFIFDKLSIKGHISTKKKVKEHHGQAYDLKYVNFPKCLMIIENIKSNHQKKVRRFQIIKTLYTLTSRNGKYTEKLLHEKKSLEKLFFE